MSTLFKTGFLVIYTLVLFAGIIFGYGVYYEQYEAIFSALGSGRLTPGIPYNDFFYLTHILLVEGYSVLYGCWPETHWLGVIQLAYLIIALTVILYVFYRVGPSKLAFVVLAIVVSVFFIEQIVSQIYTRTSFLLSFAALLALCYERRENTLSKETWVLYMTMFLIAVLTRPESAALMLIVVSVFYFLIVERGRFFERIRESIKLFAPLSIFPIVVFVWMQWGIMSTDEFYKQIEPDVEYELSVRNNIVPIGTMKTERDSFRYMAIDRVMWGDATTNDALFLRSLIGSGEDVTVADRVIQSAWTSLKLTVSNNAVIVILSMLMMCILMLQHMCNREYGQAGLVFAFAIFFIVLIVLVGYRYKMTDMAVSCLFSAVALMALTFFKHDQMVKVDLRPIAIAIAAMLTPWQVIAVGQRVNEYRDKTEFYKAALSLAESEFTNRNVLLNGESISLLYAFTPLQPFDFEPFSKVVVYDAQHISTMEPYRSHLAQHCNCDPNNYAEYFSFLKQGGDTNVFLMSEDFRIFLEQYLMVVHDLPLTFTKALDRAIVEQDDRFNDRAIWAYTIE